MKAKKHFYFISCFAVIAACLLFLCDAQSAHIQCTYDNQNRLVEVKYENGGYIEFAYDTQGNRISKVIGSHMIGDLNYDCAVDILDFYLVASNFGRTHGFPPEVDCIKDGVIDIFDIYQVAKNFLLTCDSY